MGVRKPTLFEGVALPVIFISIILILDGIGFTLDPIFKPSGRERLGIYPSLLPYLAIGTVDNISLVFGIILLVLAFLELALALGLSNGRGWAWTLTIRISILIIPVSLVEAVLEENFPVFPVFLICFSLLTIWVLTRPGNRIFFGK